MERKSNMTLLQKIINSLGLCFLFGCSGNDQQEVQNLLDWYSAQIENLASHIEHDVELDRQGHYPHAGKIGYRPVGSIAYTINDKHGVRLEVSEKLRLQASDIEQTQGYRRLAEKVSLLGWKLAIEERMVDGDGVDSYNSLDEYIDDHPRYYVVKISGWQ